MILSKLLYYLVLYPLSILPHFILYIISDILAFVFEYIVKYRKKVIIDNLKNSFPEKSEKEIDLIKHKFYKHFSDLIVESLKGFTISEKQARKRLTFVNTEDAERFYKEGRDTILLTGHFGNWEFAGSSIPLFTSHLILAVYKPLTNKFFDKKIQKSRTNFGISLASMKEIAQKVSKDYGRPKSICLATDQSPSNPNKCYWTTFLNQDTGVFYGAELFAKKHDMPILFIEILKQKRGHYKVTYTTLFENPKDTEYGEITETHTQYLEQVIKKNPEYWLWSHKRWKHKKPKNKY